MISSNFPGFQQPAAWRTDFRTKGDSSASIRGNGPLRPAWWFWPCHFVRRQLLERGFAWGVLFHSFATLRWKWVGLACLFALATYFGRALRWAVLLKPVKPKPGIWNLFSATVIGFTAIALLGRPGEFVRPYLISVKEGVPFSSQLAAWLLERIYDLLMALAVFGFALGRVQNSGVVVGKGLGWVLAIGGWFVGLTSIVILAILLVIRHFSEEMKSSSPDECSPVFSI